MRLARLVRLEHTIFALPFAYVGALLAVDGWPGLAAMAWITVAMVGARTLAIEAGKTIVLDQPDVVALADRYGLCIVAVEPDEIAA